MTVKAAALLVRISDARDEDTAGVDRQEKDGRALAERLGWPVAEVYVENDTSAYKRRKIRLPDGSLGLRTVRPEYRRLLNDLTTGRRDAVLLYDADRLARDPRDLEDLIDVVEQQHVPNRSITGSIDVSTDAGITMARVMVAMANKSSRDSARRIKRKKLELAEQGRYGGGGHRPFGYGTPTGMVDARGRPHLDMHAVRLDEAEAVRGMAERALKHQSLSAIARWLDTEGVPTVTGGEKWHNRSVHSILTNPRIAGLRVAHGEIVGEAAWPAILERDTWERVRAELSGRPRSGSRGFTRWLTTVALCGREECTRHPLKGLPGKNGHAVYWCPSNLGGCGKLSVMAERAEETVGEMIVAYLQREDVLERFSSARSDDNLSQIRADVANDKALLKQFAGMTARREITMPEYVQARREIEQRIAGYQRVIREAVPGVVRTLIRGDVRAGWDELGPVDRRDVARAVFPHGIAVMPAQRRGPVWDPHRVQALGGDGIPPSGV